MGADRADRGLLACRAYSSSHSFRRLGHAAVAAVAGHVSQAVHPLFRASRRRASWPPRCSACLLGRASSAPIVVCNNDHRFLVRDEAERAGIAPGAIVLEPVARNTAPAIAVAALLVAAHRSGRHPRRDAVGPRRSRTKRASCAAVRRAAEVAAAGRLVLFGIAPQRAAHGLRLHPARRTAAGLRGRLRRRQPSPRSRTARPPRAISRAGELLLEQRHLRARRARVSRRAGAPASLRILAAARRRWPAARDDLGFLRLDARGVCARRRASPSTMR